MRSTAQSSFAAMLLLIPILAVPMLAIFGVPDFAPVVESPLGTAEAKGRLPAENAPPFVQPVAAQAAEFAPPPGSPGAVAAGPESFPGEQQQSSRLQAIRRGGLPHQPTESAPIVPVSAATPSADSPFRAAEEAEPVPFAAQPGVIPPSQLPPRVMPPANTQSGFTTPAVASSTAPLTWRGAVQRLNQLEIRNFRLEPGRTSDQFVFICSYTPRDNPRVSYRFEAEADEPLKAVERVLLQIDNWLASR
jgi:hypothetical protein